MKKVDQKGENMKIELKIDYKGEPFIMLLSESHDALSDNVLELFIRKAKERGIEIKTEDSSLSDRYASIRLSKPKG